MISEQGIALARDRIIYSRDNSVNLSVVRNRSTYIPPILRNDEVHIMFIVEIRKCRSNRI